MKSPLSKRVLRHVRDLNRAGLSVYHKEDEQYMSSEVREVTGIVKDITEVKEKARTVASDLRKNLDEVHRQLDATQELSDALRDAGAELSGILSTQTNNPPPDADKK